MGTGTYINSSPETGGSVSKKDKKKFERYPNYKKGKFQNPIETIMKPPKFSVMMEFFKNGKNRVPDSTIKTQKFVSDKLINNNDLSFSWFGHSSLILNIENKIVLLDPVFNKRASMFTSVGPKIFDYTNTTELEDLPKIDIVVISHDHYDHLERSTIKWLKDKVEHFYVPLGVKEHLMRWGVEESKITASNWWETAKYKGLELTLTPTRHFTGRSLTNRFETLWGAWVIKGANRSVYFSGDSGYFPGFKEVGDKFGHFDLAFVECGQYHQEWKEIHMVPEESAKVGDDLNATHVVPIHWGKFKLSLHSWTEPVERFLKASKNYEYKVILPEINEVVDINSPVYREWYK